MKVKKTKLASMFMPYAISTVRVENKNHVIAATEDRGPLVTFSPPDWKAVEIMPGPGGCMSLIQRPGVPNQVLTIMQSFPGYQFFDSGVYVLEGAVGDKNWKHRRLADIPFLHRLEIVYKGGKEYLVAASIAETKDSPDDWARPGAVYAGELKGSLDQSLQMEPILPDLHKNHGLLVSTLGGKKILMITAQEGLFITNLEDDSDGWKWDRLVDHEISEVFLADLDGDGREELVTIEPFHGNKLKVYRTSGEMWEPIIEFPLDFGHGLWVGKLAEQNVILVGNRGGSRDLELYTVEREDPLSLKKHVVDEGVGSANIAVISENGVDLIFVTNHAAKEIALYEVSEL